MFLQIQPRLLQHLIRENWIHVVLIYQNQSTPRRRGRMETKHQFKIRDASPDRQPKVQSSQVRETLQRIMSGPTTTADLRSSFRQIPYTSNIRLLEDKIQDWGMYLFTISYGSYAVDQRSGDGWFSGWFKIFVICKRNSNARFLKYSMWRLLQHWTESSTILTSKEGSVWRNKKPKKRTVSFAEDRLLTWSKSTSGSLESMIPSRIMPIYLQLFFKMTIFRSSIQSGTVFYCQWRKSHLMTSWKDCTN